MAYKGIERREVERLTRLIRRLQYLDKYQNPHYRVKAEMSALAWAIPILSDHIESKYGRILPMRLLDGKEKWLTKGKLLQRDGDKCFLCHKKMPIKDRTLEHIIPLALGGKEEMDNYALSHEECNSLRGTLPVDEFDLEKLRAERDAK